MMRKPKVVILGTGGTIAGRAGSNTVMTGYQAGEIGIQTLINAVPEMLEVADVTGEQVCNIGSFDMIDDIFRKIKNCNIFISNITGNNPNVTYEMGWARAWRGLISAEMLFGSGGSKGIGYYITDRRTNMDIAGVFATILVIILIGLVVEYGVFRTIENHTFKKWGMSR